MNKTQLVDAVAQAANIKKTDTGAVIDAFLETIQNEVAKGEKVQITGFGSFERRERGEREVKNPRTGEPIKVGPSKSPHFSAGAVFKERVNK
jgi:DNA-binding protein HU-beta